MIGDIYFCPYCDSDMIPQTAGWYCRHCGCTLDIHGDITAPGYWFDSDVEKDEFEFLNNNLREK